MKKYFRTPDDPVQAGSVYSEKVAPGTHVGNWTGKILVGPEREFAKHQLGTINSERLQVVPVVYEPQGVTLKHTHPEHNQAYYVVFGEALVMVDDSEIILKPGNSIFISGTTPHGFRNIGTEPLTLLDLHTYQFPDVGCNEMGIATLIYGSGGGSEKQLFLDRELAYYVVAGLVNFWVGDETATISPGSVAFIPRGQPHSFRNATGEQLRIVSIISYDVPPPENESESYTN